MHKETHYKIAWYYIITHVHLHIFYSQSILILCGFCICEFAYLLKFICSPQVNTRSTFSVICGHAQKAQQSKKIKIKQNYDLSEINMPLFPDGMNWFHKKSKRIYISTIRISKSIK